MRREDTCCFTGHRPEKLAWKENEKDPACIKLKQELARRVQEIYDTGKRHFICGMARGCDLYFCEAVMELRGRHPDVTIEAAIPCQTQAAAWPEQERRRYAALLEKCDYETMVQHQYDRGCMMRRNRYMVDRSSVLLAVYDGMPGGTMQTVAYAMKQKINTVIVNVNNENGN